MLRATVQQSLGSHQSVFKVDEALAKRYPYKEIPFNERPQNVAYDSYGYLGLQRNINILKDNKFSNEERIKALKLIYNSCTNPDLKARAMTQFNIVDGLAHIFGSTFQNTISTVSHRILINEWGSKIVQTLAYISTFKEMLKPLVLPLVHIVTGDIMKGSSTKLKHTTHYRDKIAAAMALCQFTMCHEGCKVIISYDDERTDHNKVLDTLIYTITQTTNESLCEWCIRTISNLCEVNPKGRERAASLNIVNSLSSILDMFEIYPISLISNACLLIWNVSLDGEGKKYSKELIPKLGRVIEFCLKHIDNLDIEGLPERDIHAIDLLSALQYSTGALAAILVFEASKEFLLHNINNSDSRRDVISSVPIICKCLNLLRDKHSILYRLTHSKDYAEFCEPITKNLLSLIKLGSELPRVRDSFAKILKETKDGESVKHSTLFDFVYKDESHLFYLVL